MTAGAARLCLVPGLVVALDLRATSARADDPRGLRACDSAYEEAQSLRDGRKLKAARDQLRLCAATTCPAFMVRECTTWFTETEARIPTVVLVASDASGARLEGVDGAIDGSGPRRLDGASWEVDPGEHTFSFVGPDGVTVNKTFLVIEGQKNQRVAVQLGAAPRPAAPLPPATSPGDTQRVASFVVGGVGVAGLVTGAVFGGLGIAAWSSANGECPSHARCPSQAVTDRGHAVTFSTVADVGFIGGGILAAAGVTLYLTAPSAPSARSPGRTALAITPTALRLEGVF